MEEFDKNTIKGQANFKFVESENGVETNFDIQITNNMTVTMILATLEKIKKEIRGEEAADYILEEVVTRYKRT